MSKEKIGQFFYKFSSFSFLLAVAFLVWRRNRTLNFGVYLPTIKPSDVLFSVSLVLLVLAFFFYPRLLKNKERLKFVYSWIKPLALFYIFMLVGSAYRYSFMRQPIGYWDVLDYLRITFGVAIFFLVLFFGWRDERFTRLTIFSFLTSLFLIFFLFVPQYYIFKWYLVGSPASYTFFGLDPSPITLASYLMLPLCLLFALFFVKEETFSRKMLYGLATVFLSAILIWTGSRGGLGAVFLGMMSIVCLAAVQKKSYKIFLAGTVSIVLIFAMAFWITPSMGRNSFLLRIFPIRPELSSELLLAIPTADLIRFNQNLNSGNPVDFHFVIDRLSIWQSYFRKVMQNPFGVGPAYQTVYPEFNYSGTEVQAHDLFLEVALLAGWGGFAAFIFFLYKTAKALYAMLKRRSNFLVSTVFGAVLSTIALGVFTDSLDFRWFWIILALVPVMYQNCASYDRFSE